MCDQAGRERESERESLGIRERAGRYVPEAIETVAAIMTSDRASNADRIRAALAILDRAIGKAEGEAKDEPGEQAIREIEAELQKLMKAQA